MAEKCKRCGGRKIITANFGDTFGAICDLCDGTGVDLSTCEGVPPGSDARPIFKSHVLMPPHGYRGIRFPSRPGPNGTRETLDPDPGRWWRK